MVIVKRMIEIGAALQTVMMNEVDISHVFRQADYDHTASVVICPYVEIYILSDQSPVSQIELGVVSGKMHV